jgi:hypothetical protein
MNTKLLTSIALSLGSAGATAFFDYLVNSAAPFSKATLTHAGLAAALVMVACAKQSFLPAKPPAAS